MITSKLAKYYLTLVDSLEAQVEGDIPREDNLLSELDSLWLSMSQDERSHSNEIARMAKLTCAGATRADDFHAFSSVTWFDCRPRTRPAPVTGTSGGWVTYVTNSDNKVHELHPQIAPRTSYCVGPGMVVQA